MTFPGLRTHQTIAVIEDEDEDEEEDEDEDEDEPPWGGKWFDTPAGGLTPDTLFFRSSEETP